MKCNEQVLSFIVEWFDPHPQIVKKYVLKLHCHLNEVEMRDIQTKRTFLSKTKLPPALDRSDFFIGAKILLLSRDLQVVEYADMATRTMLESVDERTICIVSPTRYEQLGDVISLIEKAGFTLVELISTCLGDVNDAYAAADLLRMDTDELYRPEPLVIMSFRGSNSIVAVHKLIQSSTFADRGLCCANSPEEVMAYTNFFSPEQQSQTTTATLEVCTCCVIKPHAVRSRLVGALVKEIITRGFVISSIATFRLDRAAAAEFLEVYGDIVPEYKEMVDELCSGSLVAMEIRHMESVDYSTGQEEVLRPFVHMLDPGM